MRKNFEMSEAQKDRLLDAMRAVPYMIVGGWAPRSQQENANDAWAALGKELGFEPMSVQPTGRGDRFFSAEAIEPPTAAPGTPPEAPEPDSKNPSI